MTAPVAIIGAGYAGLAAAVELARNHIPCRIFEASQTLGGRARVVEKNGYRIDNGQHILIGAYTETLKLLRFLGVSPKNLHAQPFYLHIPDQLSLHTRAFPAPFNLLFALISAKGLSWRDRFALIHCMRWLKRRNFKIVPDCTVSDLLVQLGQTHSLRSLIWEPLCIAALNTPAEAASAQIFANVLRDSLASSHLDSEFLIPKIDLSELFPVQAARYLAQRNCTLNILTPIKRVIPTSQGVELEGDPFKAQYSNVIVATAPHQALHLIEEVLELQQLSQLIAGFSYEPITTAYLAYPQDKSPLRLSYPMIGLASGPFQWLFDRGQLGSQAGLFAGVISTRGPHTELSHEELGLLMHRELEQLIPHLPRPVWSQIITEKRATFACRPNLLRPISTTAIRGLYLAGDYVQTDYPATIEAAVRSGLNAAGLIKKAANSSLA